MMDRAQFMEQLKRLLSDITEAERNEALDYYESYFDDAGPENEAAVIRELGSPGKVAAIIKADLHESNDRYAEYTENGYEDVRERKDRQMPETRTKAGESKNNGEKAGQAEKGETEGAGTKDSRGSASADNGKYRGQSRAERGYHAEPKGVNAKLVLLIILLVFLSPLIVGAAGGALGIILTILLLPFILVFVLGALTIGLAVGGAVCTGVGVSLCFAHPAAGVLTIGVGLLILAGGLLSLILLVWVGGRLLPALIRKATDFCNNLLYRKRKEG